MYWSSDAGTNWTLADNSSFDAASGSLCGSLMHFTCENWRCLHNLSVASFNLGFMPAPHVIQMPLVFACQARPWLLISLSYR